MQLNLQLGKSSMFERKNLGKKKLKIQNDI